MKTIVPIDIAKLLKVKGFDEPTLSTWIDFKTMYGESHKLSTEEPYISENTKEVQIHESAKRNDYCGGNSQEYYCRTIGVKDLYWNNSKEWLKGKYSAPTIAEVVSWLYEKHGIHIEVLVTDIAPYKTFYCRVMKIDKHCSLLHNGYGDYSDSPSESYLKAIKHILLTKYIK